jgi:dimethylamine--corrinoid protein Co-methyltransferase
LPGSFIFIKINHYAQQIELAIKDMVYVGSHMYESGADGINFDTTAAAGDAEFYAALKATEILKLNYPDICIQMGMAAEFVLGMHGELFYEPTSGKNKYL